MSIIVKGMQMPSGCRACPLCQYYPTVRETRCRMTGEVMAYGFGVLKFNGRSEHCPLVELSEKHGRLIDADALIEDIRENSESYFADDFAHEWIDRQSIIVEAEGEK